MKISVILVALALIGGAFGLEKHVEQRRKPEHIQRDEERRDSVEKLDKTKIDESQVGQGKFKLDERTKQILVKEKVEEPKLVIQKTIEFFLQNPNRIFERECFAKVKAGESVDFVIDLAPSPALDKADRFSAQSPIAHFLDPKHQAPSAAYFNSIQMFIESVTFDMKPEMTHAIIYDNGKKFYIRGKAIDAPVTHALDTESGEFIDSKRNLKTMWPVPTKEVPETFLRSILKSNLGRMTNLALWNRDNGLPTVLAASRRSKPVFTIIISDGASGAKLNDLTDDLSRTTVIDIGNRRFVKNIDWNEMRKLVNVVALNAPQQLSTMVDTCRLMACRACGC